MNNHKGQLSLFMAIMFVFFFTLVAFVINVGLFVKAKINLQNAVDAAAWSGAAVQARQLTDIAHLNYEMRNVYKEWMFKYYVLGNLSNPGVRNIENNNNVDFRLDQLGTTTNLSSDLYNVPSICVGFADKADLCRIYNTPGLPRPDFLDPLALTDLTKDIEDAIVQLSAKACARKTYVNYTTALQWAFGLGGNKFFQVNDQLPEVAFNRAGAWPQAIELALRIRNLEKIVNQPPNTEGVCSSSRSGCNQVSDLEGNVGNERAVKAFYSAWRNLGNSDAREMKDTLKLTELSPTPVTSPDDANLSNLLIPGNSTAREKYYLDLKLTPINFAYFYSALNPATDQDTNQDAQCQTVKMALPVPAYPFGFIKDPKVLTYYSVKGEVEFEGLFNPFNKSIKLTAYSSAKPFGGRIGPHLFDALTFPSAVRPRAAGSGGLFSRSSPYTMGLNRVQNSGVSTTFPPIIPDDQSIWVQGSDDVIGGTIGSENIKYAHPNMLYIDEPDPYFQDPIFSIPIPDINNNTANYNVGLYKKEHLSSLKGNIANSNAPTSDDIDAAIGRVRSPNIYDAKNYLIPAKIADNKFDYYSNPIENLYVYAPLYAPGLVYESSQSLISTIQQYFDTQKGSINVFINTLTQVSENIAQQQSASGGGANLYQEAAAVIADNPLSCNSIAGQLQYFFLGGNQTPGCSESFSEAISNYFLQFESSDNPTRVTMYHNTLDKINNKQVDDRFFSAFFPGPFNGGTEGNTGQLVNPFIGQAPKSLRNFYSTKLVSFESLLSPRYEFTYGEGKSTGVAQNLFYSQISNTLQDFQGSDAVSE